MMSSSSSRGPRWTPASQQGRGRLGSSRWRSPAPTAVRWTRRPSGRPPLAWWPTPPASPWSAPSPPGGCRRWRRTMPGWARTAGGAVIPRAVTLRTSQTRRKSGEEEEWRDPATLATPLATPPLAGRSGRPGSVLPRPRATATPEVFGANHNHRPRPTDLLHSPGTTGTVVPPVIPRHTENLPQLRPAELSQPRRQPGDRRWEGGRPLTPVRPRWGLPTTLLLPSTGRGEATRGARQPGTSLVTTQESPPHLLGASPGSGRPDTPASLPTR